VRWRDPLKCSLCHTFYSTCDRSISTSRQVIVSLSLFFRKAEQRRSSIIHLRTGYASGNASHPPCLFVIFCATGDLDQAELVPRPCRRLGQHDWAGAIRVNKRERRPAELSDEDFSGPLRQALALNCRDETIDEDDRWQRFRQRKISYVSGDFVIPDTYAPLTAKLNESKSERQTQGNRISSLATAHEFLCPSSNSSARFRLAQTTRWMERTHRQTSLSYTISRAP